MNSKHLALVLTVILCHCSLSTYSQQELNSTKLYDVPPTNQVELKLMEDLAETEFERSGGGCLYPVKPMQPSTKRLCVGIRTYIKQKRQVLVLLRSLLLSGYKNLVVYVANTDFRPMNLTKIAIQYNSKCCCNHIHEFHMTQRDLPAKLRYVRRDLGYILADYMLDFFLNQKQCEYIMFADGDNMYATDFVPTVVQKMEEGYDIVATYFNQTSTKDRRVGKCKVSQGVWKKCNIPPRAFHASVQTKFQIGKIDLGCVMFHRRAFEQTGINFVLNDFKKDPRGKLVCESLNGNYYSCDGALVTRIKKKNECKNIYCT